MIFFSEDLWFLSLKKPRLFRDIDRYDFWILKTFETCFMTVYYYFQNNVKCVYYKNNHYLLDGYKALCIHLVELVNHFIKIFYFYLNLYLPGIQLLFYICTYIYIYTHTYITYIHTAGKLSISLKFPSTFLFWGYFTRYIWVDNIFFVNYLKIGVFSNSSYS